MRFGGKHPAARSEGHAQRQPALIRINASSTQMCGTLKLVQLQRPMANVNFTLPSNVSVLSGSGWWGLIPFLECVVDRLPEEANPDDQNKDWNAQQQKKDCARPEQQNGKADA